ncbi:MAG: EamA family transporter [Nitrospirae bacterium]|nr:EamA family transporter [Nitrospirota bacterium]
MGHLKIIAAILIWSSLGIFVRRIGLPNAAIVFYSAAIAGLFQFALLALTGGMKKELNASSQTNNILLFIGIPAISLANVLLFYFAFTHTTIANAVLSHYTAPIFVAVMAPLFLKERSHKTIWIAILLSSAGMWLMLWMPSSSGVMPMSVNERNGIIAGASSGFAYALIILTLRTLASRYSPLFIICIQNCIMSLILLPFMLVINFPMQSLPYLITMGMVHSTIAPLLYVQGFRSVKANEAAILGYFEPVGATLLALVFLHESPGLISLLGGALILFSGYMILKAGTN